MKMDRRNFIKTSCTLCVALGTGTVSGLLASCSSLPVYHVEMRDNIVTVPLSLFAGTDLQVVRPDGFGYDIAVHKEPDGTYIALLLRCTHADNQLNYTGAEFYCSVHGSKFDKDGLVLKGPAGYPLARFATRLTASDIIIHLA